MRSADTPNDPNWIRTLSPSRQPWPASAAWVTSSAPECSADTVPVFMPRSVKEPIVAGSTPSTFLCAAPATVASVALTSVTARTPGWAARTPARCGVSPMSALVACT